MNPGSPGPSGAGALSALLLVLLSSSGVARGQFFSFARDDHTNGCPPVTEKPSHECAGKHNPTDPFTTLELQNPSHDVSALHQISRALDLE